MQMPKRLDENMKEIKESIVVQIESRPKSDIAIEPECERATCAVTHVFETGWTQKLREWQSYMFISWM